MFKTLYRTVFPGSEPSHPDPMRVLMVCMSNICRSPMAEAVLAQLAAQTKAPGEWLVASAGTQAGGRQPVDPRAASALSRRGYALPRNRSRAVSDKDFADFDLILAMDQSNMNALRQRCPGEHVHKLRMFLEYAPGCGLIEVPDPYYGAEQGFDRVLDLCEAAARGLLASNGAAPAVKPSARAGKTPS